MSNSKIAAIVIGVGVVAAAILALFVIPGLSPTDQTVDTADEADREAAVTEANILQILRDPPEYEGVDVIVRDGTVVPIEPEGGFVLEGAGGEILVYAVAPIPRLEPGEQVGIRATVTRFTAPAAEELGSEFADAEVLRAAPTGIGDPYLLFRSVVVAGSGPPITPPLTEARSTLVDILGNPRAFYGDAVTVAGEVVRVGGQAFVLEADGEELLVVPDSPLDEAVEVGTVARVRGLVRRVPGEDTSRAVDEQELIDRYEGEPMVAATTVAVFDE